MASKNNTAQHFLVSSMDHVSLLVTSSAYVNK